MTNCNPHTGIRYGVIAFNSLADWCSDDLFYGSGAVNLSDEEAVTDIKATCAQEVQWEIDDGKHDVADEPDFDFDDEVQRRVEQALESLQIDEPIIEGECDGVKYHISWLGGAPMLWVVEGPTGNASRLCSPCVPNAADLDSGFVLETEFFDESTTMDINDFTYPCYCVPRDWLRKED